MPAHVTTKRIAIPTLTIAAMAVLATAAQAGETITYTFDKADNRTNVQKTGASN